MGTSAAPIVNFYQHRNYIPLLTRNVYHDEPNADVVFSGSLPRVQCELARFVEKVTFERVGIMRGEYVLLMDAEALLLPDGTCIKINVACEDQWADQALNEILRSSVFSAARAQIAQHWHALPVHDNLGILSDANNANYYHASLEMIPRIRFLAPHSSAIYIPQSYRHRPNIQHIVERMSPHIPFVSTPHAIRVRDPIVAHDQLSSAGVHWLRTACGLRIEPGTRRIYIRRGKTARGGGLHETESFQAILREFDIEAIDFGQGELTLAQQVERLAGAGLIIAPHGAGIANIVHLGTPMGLLEILPLQTARTMWAEVCAMLGYSYRGIYSTVTTDEGEIVPDYDELRATVIAMLSRQAA
ncbi:glycosyltransferase 61 family protein [Methylobacterium sp. ID0610]|uniref:glycosyltransferase 61 family protein n=1 Tax=Methylobacterium carpenticola TaxID=3344827 RepID=UPI00368555EB